MRLGKTKIGCSASYRACQTEEKIGRERERGDGRVESFVRIPLLEMCQLLRTVPTGHFISRCNITLAKHVGIVVTCRRG